MTWNEFVADLLINIVHWIGNHRITVQLMTINGYWCKVLHSKAFWSHSQCALIRLNSSSCHKPLPKYLEYSRSRWINCLDPQCQHSESLSSTLLHSNNSFYYLNAPIQTIFNLHWSQALSICNVQKLELTVYNWTNADHNNTVLPNMLFPQLTTFLCYSSSQQCDGIVQHLLLAMPVVNKIRINVDNFDRGVHQFAVLRALSTRTNLTSLDVRLPDVQLPAKLVHSLGALPIHDLTLRCGSRNGYSSCTNNLLKQWLPKLHSLDFFDHTHHLNELMKLILNEKTAKNKYSKMRILKMDPRNNLDLFINLISHLPHLEQVSLECAPSGNNVHRMFGTCLASWRHSLLQLSVLFTCNSQPEYDRDPNLAHFLYLASEFTKLQTLMISGNVDSPAVIRPIMSMLAIRKNTLQFFGIRFTDSKLKQQLLQQTAHQYPNLIISFNIHV